MGGRGPKIDVTFGPLASSAAQNFVETLLGSTKKQKVQYYCSRAHVTAQIRLRRSVGDVGWSPPSWDVGFRLMNDDAKMDMLRLTMMLMLCGVAKIRKIQRIERERGTWND